MLSMGFLQNNKLYSFQKVVLLRVMWEMFSFICYAQNYKEKDYTLCSITCMTAVTLVQKEVPNVGMRCPLVGPSHRGYPISNRVYRVIILSGCTG